MSRCIVGPSFAPPTLASRSTGFIHKLVKSFVLDLAKKIVRPEPRLAHFYENFPFKDKGEREERSWKITASTRRWRLSTAVFATD